MSGQRFATRWTDFLCTESLDRQGYLDYAFCLCDTSEKGRGGPRTATGVIALLGVMDTHRANTHSASSGVGGGGRRHVGPMALRARNAPGLAGAQSR